MSDEKRNLDSDPEIPSFKEPAVRRAVEALTAEWEDERACVWIPPEEQLHACRRALDASGVWDALEKRTAERNAALDIWAAAARALTEGRLTAPSWEGTARPESAYEMNPDDEAAAFAEALTAEWEDERACVWIPPEEQLHACRRALDASGVWDALEKRTAERNAALDIWAVSEERIEELERRALTAEQALSMSQRHVEELERELRSAWAMYHATSAHRFTLQRDNERMRSYIEKEWEPLRAQVVNLGRENERLRELVAEALGDFDGGAASFDDVRLEYVEVQLDKRWAGEARAALASSPSETDPAPRSEDG